MKRFLFLLAALAAMPGEARYKPANFDSFPAVQSGTLYGTDYRVSQNITITESSSQAGAVRIPDGATVTIWFANSARLTVTGNGRGPGIAVPANATLILRNVDGSSCSVVATGGNGGKGKDGSGGGDGHAGSPFYGDGGAGGAGGAAGGAGIGGVGGVGGSGGSGVEACHSGRSGNAGSNGSNGGACGRIFVYDNIKITARSGELGDSGSGGGGGSKWGAYAAGGGGGGGGRACASAAIGGGGGGGGGGGSGSTGACAGGSGSGGGGGGCSAGGGSAGQSVVGQDTGESGKTGSTQGEGGAGGTKNRNAGNGGRVGNGGAGGGIACHTESDVNNGDFSGASGLGGGKGPTTGRSLTLVNLAGCAGADEYTLAIGERVVKSPVSVPTMFDCRFLGYYLKNDRTSTQIIDANGSVVQEVVGDGTTKLYAVWETPWTRLTDAIGAGGSVRLERDYVQSGVGASVKKNVTVDLNGHAIALLGGERFAQVTDGTLTLTGTGVITNQAGYASTLNGSFVSVEGSSACFEMKGGVVGGLTTTGNGTIAAVKGSVKLSGGFLANCSAGCGGAVYVDRNGTFDLSGDIILSNTTATTSGAMVYSLGETTLSGGCLKRLKGATGDAIVVADGTTIVLGGVLGGVPARTGGTLTIYGGVFDTSVSSNLASGYVAEKVRDSYVVAKANTVATGGDYLSAGTFTFSPSLAIYNRPELRLLDPNGYCTYHVTATSSTPPTLYDLRRTDGNCVGCNSWEQIRTNMRAGYGVKLTTDFTQGESAVALANGSFKVDLASRTLTAAAGKALFEVGKGATLTLTDESEDVNGKLKGASAARTVDGGAVTVANGGLLVLKGGRYADFKTTRNGGFAYVASGGSLRIEGGTIDGCSATNGGAIYAEGSVVVSDGGIVHCTAEQTGGAIAITKNGSLAMSGGILGTNTVTTSGDATTSFGGAVFSRGEVAFTGGTIDLNTADSGGGLASLGGSVAVTGPVVFRGNKARKAGGGLLAGEKASVTLKSGYFLVNAGEGAATGAAAIRDAGTVLTMTGGIFERNKSDTGEPQLSASDGASLKIYGGVFSMAPTGVLEGYEARAVDRPNDVPIYVVAKEHTVQSAEGRLTAGTFTFHPVDDPLYAAIGLVDPVSCNITPLGGTPPHWAILTSESDTLFVEGRLKDAAKNEFVTNATIKVRAYVSKTPSGGDVGAEKTSQFATDANGYYSTMVVCDIAKILFEEGQAYLGFDLTNLTTGATYTLPRQAVGYVPYALHARQTDRVTQESAAFSGLTITNAGVFSTLFATNVLRTAGTLIVTGEVSSAATESLVVFDRLTVGTAGTSLLAPSAERTTAMTACGAGATATARVAAETDGFAEVVVALAAGAANSAVTIERMTKFETTETLVNRTGLSPDRCVFTVPVRAGDIVSVTVKNAGNEAGAITTRLMPFGVKKL